MAKAKPGDGSSRKIILNKGKKKKTSIGKRAKVKNKSKKRSSKAYRGQGR